MAAATSRVGVVRAVTTARSLRRYNAVNNAGARRCCQPSRTAVVSGRPAEPAARPTMSPARSKPGARRGLRRLRAPARLRRRRGCGSCRAGRVSLSEARGQHAECVYYAWAKHASGCTLGGEGRIYGARKGRRKALRTGCHAYVQVSIWRAGSSASDVCGPPSACIDRGWARRGR